MGKSYDIIGKKFGRYTVLEQSPNGNTNQSRWRCQCECGTIKSGILGRHLITGNILSCGCYGRDKERINIVQWKGFGEISGVYWGKLKKSAIKRNHEFSITIEYAWEQYIKQNRKCALTGVDLCFIRDYARSSNQTASLDRTDSSKGYIVGNIQWVHKEINDLKRDFEESKFIELCKKIVKHKKEKYEQTI